jgi:UDP-N-acetylglucosamine diphosphorylase / glucose-1-phosphate thymidylyltransferase / UDP-N-acetylgalactosamine diphosphorylase / glucosamine-1-phosphate N-acetyltransferase / galactosamine-1-phosphate N-acetyltransferase|tara:strand:- start:4031 stop:4753 length:723 start_codon:yes stop_codon:yes gene_type:complete
MNILIPMAGLGSRFPRDKFKKIKPLIEINAVPMIIKAIKSLDLEGDYFFVIRKDKFSNELKTVIESIQNKINILEINYKTSGPAETALLFSDQINSDNELIIANCDQIMEWDSNNFLHNVRQYDGAVVTYHATTDKNSYARLNKNGEVVEIREKEVISSTSLNGIHYWKKGCDFVKSANEMISADDKANNGEFYIGPSYNYMIKNEARIGIFHIPKEMHHAVGDPEDLLKYINYENNRNK